MSAKRRFPDEYGKMKIKVEELVRNSGLDYTILRPSMIYGPGSTSFDFILERFEKIPLFTPIIGNGKSLIRPVHIDDVIEAIVKSMEDKITINKEYELVGGEEVYFIDIINLLKRSKHIEKKNFYVPLAFCYVLATLFPQIITKESVRNFSEERERDFTETLANIDLLRMELNYTPVRFSEGIKNGLI